MNGIPGGCASLTAAAGAPFAGTEAALAVNLAIAGKHYFDQKHESCKLNHCRAEADTRACCALAAARCAREPQYCHTQRTCAALAETGPAYGLDGMAIRRLELGASPHDIGKLACRSRPASSGPPAGRKTGPHAGNTACWARRIIAATGLTTARRSVRICQAHHHEYYDGSGWSRRAGRRGHTARGAPDRAGRRL